MIARLPVCGTFRLWAQKTQRRFCTLWPNCAGAGAGRPSG